jgi:hypothetical protein
MTEPRRSTAANHPDSGRFCVELGSVFLAIVFAMLLTSTVSFWLGGTIGGQHLPLSLGLALLSIWIFDRHSGRKSPTRRLLLVALTVGVLALSILLANSFFDTSYDGQFYHQRFLIEILEGGWNPILDSFEGEGPIPTILNHYPRGAYYASLPIIAATGQLESGKAIHLLLLAATFLLASGSIQRFTGWSHPQSLLFGAIIAANPVALYQSLSFYVDGLLASALTCFLVSCALPIASPLMLFNQFASLALLVNLKATGLVYAGLFGLAYCVIHKVRGGRFVSSFSRVALSLLVSLGLFGFTPYLTNFATHGHLFYPLNEIDVLEGQRPGNLIGASSLQQCFNHFAKPSNRAAPAETQLALPFSLGELDAYANPDVRAAGFGPLFSASFLLAVILLALMITKRKSRPPISFFLVAILLLFSTWIHPAAWWARYVPQLFLFPVLIFLGFLYWEPGRRRLLGHLGMGLLFVNLLLIGTIYFRYNLQASARIHAQLVRLSHQNPVVFVGSFKSLLIRLREHGVDFTEVSSREKLGCQTPQPIVGTPQGLVCAEKRVSR